MPNNPLLNIKSLSVGKSGSIVGFVVPTEKLTQDVKPYIRSNEEIPSIATIKGAFGQLTPETIDATPRNAAEAVARYLAKDYPSYPLDNIETKIDNYLPIYKKIRLAKWQVGILSSCVARIEEELLDSETPNFEDFTNDIYGILAQTYPFEPTTTQLTALEKAKELFDIFTESNTEATEYNLSEISSKFQRIGKILEFGGSEYNFSVDSNDSISNLKKELSSIAGIAGNFYKVIESVSDYEELPGNETERNVKNCFEGFIFTHNRRLLEAYKKRVVQFPYAFESGFDKQTKEDLSTDAFGLHMHDLEREGENGWDGNYQYGDRLRVRDLFRIDKLNKKSAYESGALYPGMSGHELDEKLEYDDVITRLAQNDWDYAGVVAFTGTTNGTYLVTDGNDVIGAASRGTDFDETPTVKETGSFRSFSETSEIADYLTYKLQKSCVNFERAYEEGSPHLSYDKEFSEWHRIKNGAIVVHPAKTNFSGSILKALSESSFDFQPSRVGIYRIATVMEEFPNIEDDMYLKIPTNGFELKATLGDSNYQAGVPRSLILEIPYSKDSQYSYVALDFKFATGNDSSMITSVAGRDVSIEFSLDDNQPIRFYLVDPKAENLDETNPLYYSMLDFKYKSKLPSMGKTTSLLLKIENDMVGTESRQLKIAVTSNVPELLGTASDSTRIAYNEAALTINKIKVGIFNATSYDLSYADYLTELGNKVANEKFWLLSRAMDNPPYQQMLEVPKAISLNITKTLHHNFQTADLFSDVMTLKNQMDSEYRMLSGNKETRENIYLDCFRTYTFADCCSNTISLYYNADKEVVATETDNEPSETVAKRYDTNKIADSNNKATILKYKRIETIRGINRFTSSIKHKSNLFSVIIHNSGVKEAVEEARLKLENSIGNEAIEAQNNLDEVQAKVDSMKKTIGLMVRGLCEKYAPAHNQLFDVYFE